MKKFLSALVILILVGVAGLSVFIATFDADRYRPMLVEQLQKALGRPVVIKHISLGWHNGITTHVQGLTIPEGAGEPLVQVDSISAVIRLMPLLRRQVEVSSVLLDHPRLLIVRNAQGQVNVAGLASAALPSAAAAAPASSSSSTPAAINFQIETVRVVDGSLHWRDSLSQPAAEITVHSLNMTVEHIAPAQPMDVMLSAAIDSAQPNIKFQGRILPPSEKEAGWIKQAQLSVNHAAIASFLPVLPSGSPKPRGWVTAQMQLELPTLSQAQLIQQLSAAGTVNLDDFVIENANVLRSVFDRLSMLPGLVQRLEADLPPEYLQKLNARNMTFAPIHLPVKLGGGALVFDQVDLRTDVIRLAARGQVGVLDQSVTMKSLLYVDRTLSDAIIHRAKELGSLANAAGELEIPVVIQGRMPQLAVLPDLRYVASKVVVQKAIDVIGGLLEKKSEASANPETGQATPQAEPTPEELIGGLLQRALRKHSSQEQPAVQPAK